MLTLRFLSFWDQEQITEADIKFNNTNVEKLNLTNKNTDPTYSDMLVELSSKFELETMENNPFHSLSGFISKLKETGDENLIIQFAEFCKKSEVPLRIIDLTVDGVNAYLDGSINKIDKSYGKSLLSYIEEPMINVYVARDDAERDLMEHLERNTRLSQEAVKDQAIEYLLYSVSETFMIPKNELNDRTKGCLIEAYSKNT